MEGDWPIASQSVDALQEDEMPQHKHDVPKNKGCFKWETHNVATAERVMSHNLGRIAKEIVSHLFTSLAYNSQKAAFFVVESALRNEKLRHEYAVPVHLSSLLDGLEENEHVWCSSPADVAVGLARWCLLRLTRVYARRRLEAVEEENAALIKAQETFSLSQEQNAVPELSQNPDYHLSCVYQTICLFADFLLLGFLPFSTGLATHVGCPAHIPTNALRQSSNLDVQRLPSFSSSITSFSSCSRVSDNMPSNGLSESKRFEKTQQAVELSQRPKTEAEDITAGQSTTRFSTLKEWVINLFERILVLSSGLGTTCDAVWDARLHFQLAVLHIIYGQPRLALEALRIARMIVQGYGPTAQSRALCTALMGSVQESNKPYLPPTPSAVPLVLVTAKTLLNDIGNYPEAISCCVEWIKENRARWVSYNRSKMLLVSRVYHLLGIAYAGFSVCFLPFSSRRLELLQNAEKELKRAIQYAADPETQGSENTSLQLSVVCWKTAYHYALVLAHLDRFSEAHVWCLRSIRLFPGYPAAWILLAGLTSTNSNGSFCPHIFRAQFRMGIRILEQGLAHCPSSLSLKLVLLLAEARVAEEYDPYRFFAHAVLLVDNRPSRNGEKLPEQWTAEFPGLDHLMRAVPPWSDLTSQHGVTTKQSPLGTPCVRIKRRTGTWRRKGPQSTAKLLCRIAFLLRSLFGVLPFLHWNVTRQQHHPRWRLRQVLSAIRSLEPKEVRRRSMPVKHPVLSLRDAEIMESSAATPRKEERHSQFDCFLLQRLSLEKGLLGTEPSPKTPRDILMPSLQSSLPVPETWGYCNQAQTFPIDDQLKHQEEDHHHLKDLYGYLNATGLLPFSVGYSEDRIPTTAFLFFVVLLLLDLGQVVLAKDAVECLRYISVCLDGENDAVNKDTKTPSPFPVALGLLPATYVKIAAAAVAFAEASPFQEKKSSLKKLARLRSCLFDALTVAPFNIKLLQMDACTLIRIGSFTAAKSSLKRALQLDAGNILTRRLLAESCAALGLYEQALMHSKTALILQQRLDYLISFCWLPFYYP